MTEQTWTRTRQEIGICVWSSFLTACGATFLFFGLLDPDPLIEFGPGWFPESRTGVYSLGFLFFWLVGAAAAAAALFLIRTRPGRQTRRAGH